MKILPKDFLSIEDVAKYFEEIGDSYDLEMKYESQRLLSNIYDLINENKITAVFYHYGHVVKRAEYFKIDEDNRDNPIRIPLHEENTPMIGGYYFYISKNYLKDLFLNEKEVEVDRYIDKYEENIFSSEGEDIFYCLDNSIKVSIRDIRIPKCELDALFEGTSPNSIINNHLYKSSQKLLIDERLSHVVGVGNHKVLQGSPKTDKQIIDEFREQVAKLNSEKEQLKLQLGQQIIKLNSEKENLTLQSEQRVSTPIDDEPTHHKSVGSMQALVTTLIKMAEYDKVDLADPYGELNKLIQAKAEGLELSVKKDFIAKWLKKADEVL